MDNFTTIESSVRLGSVVTLFLLIQIDERGLVIISHIMLKKYVLRNRIIIVI